MTENKYDCEECEKQSFFKRCNEHKICDECGTRENLCYRNEGLLCDPCFKKIVDGRIKNFKGDTTYTSEVTCPHCGHIHSDSWEYSEGKHECMDCELPFDMWRYTEITYSTKKIKQKTVA